MIDLENVDLAQVEAVLVTNHGQMVLGFRPDKAPAHVRNFLTLAQDGFYDGTAFHRVIKDFMVQGGCPNTKEGASGRPGTGSPGHRVHAEFNDLPHTRGAVSMARGQDPNSAGSQFFLVHAEHAAFLDGQYTVFGGLKDGHDVLDEIAQVECAMSGRERSMPSERIALEQVELRMAAPEPEPQPDSDGDATDGEGAAGSDGGDGDGGDA